ncbi:hypothetical protein [Thermocaproicibacter melissae]|uniref:hypothetical protein n=1 Tax=Thermocaproicibacter melissae TaxID=2966552 RepID=UPI0024B04F6A|nr:hypothetical protein [Thermocaproicibacter melissae]WBY63374.1 hypothetical protein NOG13_05215 [Thermocaproicibacter melissae]
MFEVAAAEEAELAAKEDADFSISLGDVAEKAEWSSSSTSFGTVLTIFYRNVSAPLLVDTEIKRTEITASMTSGTRFVKCVLMLTFFLSLI